MFGATAPSPGFGAQGAGFGKTPTPFASTTLTSTNTIAPPGGGFKPTTGTSVATGAPGFGAAAGVGTGGFGAKTSAGFGASATTGFGAPATATTGFGAPATATTGFGAPATGTTGFGAPATATTGFGAPATGTTGFGAPATATTGFGAPAMGAAGGWAMPQAPVLPQQPTVTLQDFTRQSALANYLVKLDESYNALHPNCHFRAFVYNICAAGQVMDAIQKERYTAYLNGGGCGDEAYMQALQKNPDPDRLYPSPVHFSQELLRRTEKQRAAVTVLQTKVAELLQDVDAVAAMDAANARRQREVEQEEVMLRHRWYLLLCKMELLRRHGSSYGEESLLNSRVEQLRQLLRAPGRFGQLLGELRPFVTEQASRVAIATQKTANRSEARQQQKQQQQSHLAGGAQSACRNADDQPLLRSEVDPYLMRDWIQFAKQMQDGIETLDELLRTDLKEMRAIRSRVEAA